MNLSGIECTVVPVISGCPRDPGLRRIITSNDRSAPNKQTSLSCPGQGELRTVPGDLSGFVPGHLTQSVLVCTSLSRPASGVSLTFHLVITVRLSLRGTWLANEGPPALAKNQQELENCS